MREDEILGIIERAVQQRQKRRQVVTRTQPLFSF